MDSDEESQASYSGKKSGIFLGTCKKAKEYRILGKKGEGTFSEVLKCQNIKDGSYVACKKMKQTYSSIEQVNNLREIQAMRRLSPHSNVLELQEVIFDKKSGTLVLVCELMDMNIYELIRGKRHYLPERKVKQYMYQLLKSVDHMHRNGIFHRDVKPENILIKEDLLKLADFGSCRSVYSKQPYTEYISTRWYRAPECLLTDGYYTYKMDLWSVGCVFFEILSLHPLFPGSNEVDQIAKIHDIMGTPEPSVLDKLKRSRGMSFNFPAKKGSGIERLLPNVSPEAIELIYLMCKYDPDERVTAKQAVRHHYFKDLRDADRRVAAANKARQIDETSKKAVEVIKHPSNPPMEEVKPEEEEEIAIQAVPETEMKIYSSVPKAQSLPLPQHMYRERRRVGAITDRSIGQPKVDAFQGISVSDSEASNFIPTRKARKRRKHKRYAESQQFPNHTGLLPHMPKQLPSYNPSYHSTSFASSFNKLHSSNPALFPTINNVNTYKPHKAQAKPSKGFYGTYTLPSLDRRF